MSENDPRPTPGQDPGDPQKDPAAGEVPDTGEDSAEAMPRSRFLNVLLGTGATGLAAAVLYPVSAYVIPPDAPESAASSVALSVRPEDVAPNTGRIFKFGAKPGILVRTPGGELRAFSAVCTHLECTVQYRDDLSHIWCACHNGHFDLQGRNIAGPPPSPLIQYDVFERENEIVVSKRS